MIPASISASSAASSKRSTVHHQAAKRVRSRRETIETPLGNGRGSDQWCLPLVDRGLILAGKQETAGVCTRFVFQLLVGNFLLTITAGGSTKPLHGASHVLPRFLLT